MEGELQKQEKKSKSIETQLIICSRRTLHLLVFLEAAEDPTIEFPQEECRLLGGRPVSIGLGIPPITLSCPHEASREPVALVDLTSFAQSSAD